MAKASRSDRLQQIRQRGFFPEGSDEEQLDLALSVDSGTPIAEHTTTRTRTTPTTTETVNATNAYVIDYKDQARSVDHRFPVSNSARRVATGDMPIAMAVAVTDITDDYKSSIVSKQTPSDIATRFDV